MLRMKGEKIRKGIINTGVLRPLSLTGYYTVTYLECDYRRGMDLDTGFIDTTRIYK
jgi:hypothetical protein